MIVFYGFIILVAVLVVWVIGKYNSLITLRNQVTNGWKQIDVQLKRRHDLIPNLVETVKGYAAHEKGTFENIAKWRSAAMQATEPGARVEAEGMLTQALRGLLAVAENYPQLRASEQFTSLQASLNEVEGALQNSRRYYNAVVRDFNTKLEVFPSNLIAGMFKFTPKPFFEVSTAAERENVAVKF